MGKINFTREESLKLKCINNLVLVKPAIDTSKRKIGKNKKLILDTWFDEHVHSKRVVEVVKIPENLVFSKNMRIAGSMSWKTNIEVQVGDRVWIRALAAIDNDETNMNKIFIDNEEHWFINYEDFIVAKRNNEYVIPLNGYVLMQPVREDLKERLPGLELVQDKGKLLYWEVKFSGVPNEAYRYSKKLDFKNDLPEDTEVGISRKRRPYLMEDDMHKCFNGDEEYYFIQRADIVYIKLKDAV